MFTFFHITPPQKKFLSSIIKNLAITSINNPAHSCKEHLDIWYRFSTDGREFNIDPREFHETSWLTIQEARQLVTDLPNIEALDKIEQLFSI
ncbi:MAG: hypothetical protein HYX20_02805 [Candidatus Yanofskybacteria bacterium]|nr:hypothetical protein [Candidatus Yanofskybacteria bacterium]